MFPGGQPDMSELLKQAQQMQQQLAAAQEQLAREEVTGTAGGDLVSVTMTGQGEVTAVTIAPAAVDPDDVESLQDLVVAAFRRSEEHTSELQSRQYLVCRLLLEKKNKTMLLLITFVLYCAPSSTRVHRPPLHLA